MDTIVLTTPTVKKLTLISIYIKLTNKCGVPKRLSSLFSKSVNVLYLGKSVRK